MSEGNSQQPPPQALHEIEMQQVSQLLQTNVAIPIQNILLATNILKMSLDHSGQELVMQRTFELHLRDNTVTEEILAQHLDSLVALRQRLRKEAEEKFAYLRQPTSVQQPTNNAVNKES